MRIAGFAVAAVLVASPAFSTEPVGEWAVPGDVAHLRIADCGGRLWGVVPWERNPGIDLHNPDPAKRDRPMLGVPILLGMKQARPNRWDGKIYNAITGQIYPAEIRLAKADILHVEGCLLGVRCGAQDWTRVAGPGASPRDPAPPGRAACARQNRGHLPGRGEVRMAPLACSNRVQQPRGEEDAS